MAALPSLAPAVLAEELTHLALCWRLVRRDGVALGFTSHDRPLLADGLRHESRPGMSPSAVVLGDGVSADDMEVAGALSTGALGFGYDPARPVLHGISFIAEPGQTIALVGHTGCGKSTIINLIAKFWLPTSGALLIDNHEVRAIATDSLHRQMGIVTQANILFSGTVMDNIRLGRPEATDQDVIEAVRKLGILDLVAELSNGFNTTVGEKGSGVSLGQRQLICFARAMLADPRILILDEATSSVDAMTESRLQAALETLLKGRTSFVVAHRLSTIRDADQVLVLDHGRIIERGRHQELLDLDGTYAELHRRFSAKSED